MEPRATLVQEGGVTLVEMFSGNEDSKVERLTLDEAQAWVDANVNPPCERGDCLWCKVMDVLDGIR